MAENGLSGVDDDGRASHGSYDDSECAVEHEQPHNVVEDKDRVAVARDISSSPADVLTSVRHWHGHQRLEVRKRRRV
jgi:hypothetical protein